MSSAFININREFMIFLNTLSIDSDAVLIYNYIIKLKTKEVTGVRKQKSRQKAARLRRVIFSVLILVALLTAMTAVAVFSVSGAMRSAMRDRIISASDVDGCGDFDCILVLGAGVRDDGSPSVMLRDRVATGISLFRDGASARLLMSGDHGRENYDEVNVMKRLATEAGIDPDAVFCDHAGFSTYESIYRAKEIFGAERVLIVTQEYHLYRALYVARRLGLEAYGVSADVRSYRGQTYRDLREDLARFKDFFTAQIKPQPTYLGDRIPLSGQGSLTDG